MRRGFLHVGAWALATAAAVTLSWFGVHSVLRSTAYDPPRAVRIPVSPPEISATHRPRPATASPAPSSSSSSPRRTPASAVPPQRPPGTAKPTASAAGTDSGSVRPYTVRGGRVVLDLAASSASLVSATPNAGWRMQVWTQDGWLRVTFTSSSGSAASSVFCTWNGHPPTVEKYEN